MLDKNEVKQLIFKDYGISVADDDPILAFLAIHDVMIKRYADHFEEANKAIPERIEQATQRHLQDLGNHDAKFKQALEEYAQDMAQQNAVHVSAEVNSMLDKHYQQHSSAMNQLSNDLQRLVNAAHKETQQGKRYMWGSALLFIFTAVLLVFALLNFI